MAAQKHVPLRSPILGTGNRPPNELGPNTAITSVCGGISGMCVGLPVCHDESFRSVQVLCISPGLDEQTDTDNSVAPKSALPPKPNDIRDAEREDVFVHTRSI